MSMASSLGSSSNRRMPLSTNVPSDEDRFWRNSSRDNNQDFNYCRKRPRPSFSPPPSYPPPRQGRDITDRYNNNNNNNNNNNDNNNFSHRDEEESHYHRRAQQHQGPSQQRNDGHPGSRGYRCFDSNDSYSRCGGRGDFTRDNNSSYQQDQRRSDFNDHRNRRIRQRNDQQHDSKRNNGNHTLNGRFIPPPSSASTGLDQDRSIMNRNSNRNERNRNDERRFIPPPPRPPPPPPPPPRASKFSDSHSENSLNNPSRNRFSRIERRSIPNPPSIPQPPPLEKSESRVGSQEHSYSAPNRRDNNDEGRFIPPPCSPRGSMGRVGLQDDNNHSCRNRSNWNEDRKFVRPPPPPPSFSQSSNQTSALQEGSGIKQSHASRNRSDEKRFIPPPPPMPPPALKCQRFNASFKSSNGDQKRNIPLYKAKQQNSRDNNQVVSLSNSIVNQNQQSSSEALSKELIKASPQNEEKNRKERHTTDEGRGKLSLFPEVPQVSEKCKDTLGDLNDILSVDTNSNAIVQKKIELQKADSIARKDTKFIPNSMKSAFDAYQKHDKQKEIQSTNEINLQKTGKSIGNEGQLSSSCSVKKPSFDALQKHQHQDFPCATDHSDTSSCMRGSAAMKILDIAGSTPDLTESSVITPESPTGSQIDRPIPIISRVPPEIIRRPAFDRHDDEQVCSPIPLLTKPSDNTMEEVTKPDSTEEAQTEDVNAPSADTNGHDGFGCCSKSSSGSESDTDEEELYEWARNMFGVTARPPTPPSETIEWAKEIFGVTPRPSSKPPTGSGIETSTTKDQVPMQPNNIANNDDHVHESHSQFEVEQSSIASEKQTQYSQSPSQVSTKSASVASMYPPFIKHSDETLPKKKKKKMKKKVERDRSPLSTSEIVSQNLSQSSSRDTLYPPVIKHIDEKRPKKKKRKREQKELSIAAESECHTPVSPPQDFSQSLTDVLDSRSSSDNNDGKKLKKKKKKKKKKLEQKQLGITASEPENQTLQLSPLRACSESPSTTMLSTPLGDKNSAKLLSKEVKITKKKKPEQNQFTDNSVNSKTVHYQSLSQLTSQSPSEDKPNEMQKERSDIHTNANEKELKKKRKKQHFNESSQALTPKSTGEDVDKQDSQLASKEKKKKKKKTKYASDSSSTSQCKIEGSRNILKKNKIKVQHNMVITSSDLVEDCNYERGGFSSKIEPANEPSTYYVEEKNQRKHALNAECKREEVKKSESRPSPPTFSKSETPIAPHYQSNLCEENGFSASESNLGEDKVLKLSSKSERSGQKKVTAFETKSKSSEVINPKSTESQSRPGEQKVLKRLKKKKKKKRPSLDSSCSRSSAFADSDEEKSQSKFDMAEFSNGGKKIDKLNLKRLSKKKSKKRSSISSISSSISSVNGEKFESICRKEKANVSEKKGDTNCDGVKLKAFQGKISLLCIDSTRELSEVKRLKKKMIRKQLSSGSLRSPSSLIKDSDDEKARNKIELSGSKLKQERSKAPQLEQPRKDKTKGKNTERGLCHKKTISEINCSKKKNRVSQIKPLRKEKRKLQPSQTPSSRRWDISHESDEDRSPSPYLYDSDEERSESPYLDESDEENFSFSKTKKKRKLNVAQSNQATRKKKQRCSPSSSYCDSDDDNAYHKIDLSESKRKADLAKPLTAKQIRKILGEDANNDPVVSSETSHWVRRSVRQPSRHTLSSPQIKTLLKRLRNDDSDMVVLKMKKYLSDPAAPTVVIDAVLQALEKNTNCEALYIQNFNMGVRDMQVLHLLRILQLPTCKIWCLNIGETYNVMDETWETFAEGLKKTNVTHMYASEHTITGTLKEQIRETIRLNRKKHNLHVDPENLDTIVQCTHCWWNPINAKVLRPYLKKRGLENILNDKEAQGLRGSMSSAPSS